MASMSQGLSRGPVRSRADSGPVLAYVILGIGAIAMIVPFFWMLTMSLKDPSEILKPQFLPAAPTLDNYTQVLTRTLFPNWYFNSLIAATVSTASVAFFDSITGYVFAKFEFPGKRIAFLLILATLMVPTEMLVIPWFIMATGAKLADTTLGIVVLPALAAVCIFNFLGNWNAYIWPLIVTSQRLTMTLPIGLAFFSNEAGSAWNLIMTGATLSTVPLLTVFVFMQKQIIQGVALTGMKS